MPQALLLLPGAGRSAVAPALRVPGPRARSGWQEQSSSHSLSWEWGWAGGAASSLHSTIKLSGFTAACVSVALLSFPDYRWWDQHATLSWGPLGHKATQRYWPEYLPLSAHQGLGHAGASYPAAPAWLVPHAHASPVLQGCTRTPGAQTCGTEQVHPQAASPSPGQLAAAHCQPPHTTAPLP